MFHAESNPFCAAGLWFCSSSATYQHRGRHAHDVVLRDVLKRSGDVLGEDERLRELVEARFGLVVAGRWDGAHAWFGLCGGRGEGGGGGEESREDGRDTHWIRVG